MGTKTAHDSTTPDAAGTTAHPPAYDIGAIRKDFPILGQTVRGKPLVYLDNAATTQKPQAMIDAVSTYYAETNANIHRGVYQLSQKSTTAYENARKTVQRFLNARDPREIIFVRGTTEAVNLVAKSFCRLRLKPGDEIILSAMEHHSNIVPWQILCQEKNVKLRVIPMTESGELDLDAFEPLLSPRTKLVGIVHVSNALGTINPVRKIIEIAHAHDVPVLVDGAQSLPHFAVDVQELDCDFFAFSGHKIYGPTGIGALYGKSEWLDIMPPFQGGGDMIKYVTFEKTEYSDVPHKFEAGTPNIAGAVGLAAALDYLSGIGQSSIAAHENRVTEYAERMLTALDGLRPIGTAKERAGVLSFVLEDVHPHDIGTILDQEGVAIRTGHHCAQPVMDFYGVPATARASIGLYNTTDEIDALAAAIRKVFEVFGR